MEDNMEFPKIKKKKKDLLFSPPIPLLGINPKKMKTGF
jgi:hypothetical protein